MAADPQNLLEVTGLAVQRGGIAVLAGISLALKAGEALILRGPNGSGKTTLLRTIAGLQPALDGRLSTPEGAIAYAAHADGVKSVLTVAENLRFWAGIYGFTSISRAMAAFDLETLADRQALALSAGQKRRLGLARLLVTGRPVWVLDEPTVSLDREAAAMFAEVIGAHLSSGGAALIATHIDLGMEAAEFDVTPYRASAETARSAFDEAFH